MSNIPALTYVANSNVISEVQDSKQTNATKQAAYKQYLPEKQSLFSRMWNAVGNFVEKHRMKFKISGPQLQWERMPLYGYLSR